MNPNDQEQPASDQVGQGTGMSYTPMQIAAMTAHEQYACWRRAGFSRTQAFTLLRDMMAQYRAAQFHGDGSD